MSTTFESCNETVMALLRRVMRDHHNALNANEVTIDAIWARRTDEDENGDETLVPALRQHGYPGRRGSRSGPRPRHCGRQADD